MIKDERLMGQLSDMLLTLEQAGNQLLEFIIDKEYIRFKIIYGDMLEALKQIQYVSKQLKEKNPYVRLVDACQCALDSLERISEYYRYNPKKCIDKLKFELIPILQVMYIQFRYWGCAYPDKKKIESFKANELEQYVINPYIKQDQLTEEYKYDLSVVIVGYNKLEYTKLCVESLLEHMPDGIEYELILINHGSNDGTQSYFEGINPTKQLDISVNGVMAEIVLKVCEGKYALMVSNDTVITEGAIENMLMCMEEDTQVGWVVPTTPNVTNLQTIPLEYKDLQEMHREAKKNNKRNPLREEQRVRLCNPITLTRIATHIEMFKQLYVSLYGCTNIQSFPDDKCSLWLRRNGYKLILAKDAYCYHFGSVTLGDEISKENEQVFYLEGRRKFLEDFGVDPWGSGGCYNPFLMSKLPCDELESINILGVNCGLGSNPLKVKELIRENTGNNQCKVYNIINEDTYYKDLVGVSDYIGKFEKLEELEELLKNICFKYIIIEDGIENNGDLVLQLKGILKVLKKNSKCCIKIKDSNYKHEIIRMSDNVEVIDEWLIITK